MASSYTTNKKIEKPANGDYNNTWSTPVNNDWDIIDRAFGGTTSLNAVGKSGTVALTVTEYQAPIIVITGSLTANVNYQLPAGVGGFWYIFNNTTSGGGGPYAIVFSSAGGGSTVVLAQTKTTAVICDGTNAGLADTNASSAAAGGSNTQIQFNNSGVLAGSASLTWNGSTLTASSFTGPLTGNASTATTATSATTATTATTANALATGNNYQVNSFGVGTAGSGTAGEIRATNNVTAYYSSDARLKENVQPIANALDIVSSVGGKTFDWTDAYIADHGGEDGYFVQKSDFGVIAQDVKAVFPLAVRTRDDGTLAVDYEKLVAVAFAAIAELKAEVDALRGAK